MTIRNSLSFLSCLLLLCLAMPRGAARGQGSGNTETLSLTQLEDSLVVMADSMKLVPIPDYRMDYCARFVKHLKTALETPGSFNYPFTRLSEKIHILTADDKSFRIFNWLVIPSTTTRRYFGAVQMAGEEARFYPLKDRSQEIDRTAATAIVGNDSWYGCEYYKIMPLQINGARAYLLFGYNTNGNSNKKLLDVLSFTDRGPEFGASVFTVPDTRGQMVQQSRFILEYKKEAEVFLNYDNEKKMIVFNRIASEVSDPNRKSTYIPTGQMDGLRWDRDRFTYIRDAIPVLKLQDGQAPVDGVMGKGG